MAKHKPVSDDEIARAMIRIEDVRDLVEDMNRRMNGKGAPIPTFEIEPVLEANAALNNLIAAWIRSTQKGPAP